MYTRVLLKGVLAKWPADKSVDEHVAVQKIIMHRLLA